MPADEIPGPPTTYRHVRLPKRIRLPAVAYANTEAVFHVVIRAMPQTAPFRERQLGQSVWDLVCGQNPRGKVRLHAACLMPDHLHLVVSPREQTLIAWVNSFKSFSTRASWASRDASALWQPSFYDRRLRDLGEFEAALRYVMDNPVAEGLVVESEAWPWVGVWLESEDVG